MKNMFKTFNRSFSKYSFKNFAEKTYTINLVTNPFYYRPLLLTVVSLTLIFFLKPLQQLKQKF